VPLCPDCIFAHYTVGECAKLRRVFGRFGRWDRLEDDPGNGEDYLHCNRCDCSYARGSRHAGERCCDITWADGTFYLDGHWEDPEPCGGTLIKNVEWADQ
jgi:hypothetical protein